MTGSYPPGGGGGGAMDQLCYSESHFKRLYTTVLYNNR